MPVQNLFFGGATKPETVAPGLSRKVGAHSDNVMVVEVHFEAGTTAPLHHHVHEQITYVMSGKFEFTVGDKTYIVGAGDSLYKQPNIEHGATCLEAGTLLDVFTPQREDFL
ncbi:cupin domain-containing protein [Litoreibacter albidus]|uniref:cupin domain-containing protein n=1 Tax=Litoreibacter albidus TaxID=670155 RepID=UPI003736465B